MATVTFKDASRIYPKTTRKAVNQLTLEVNDGEFLVLVGPSGCGKTTSLRMLAGLEDVDEGEILIDDKNVVNLPPRDRDIAMVFQNYALYPHMNVAQNMGFALKIAKVKKAEIAERVQEAAKILDLEDYLQRKPGQLSGGQRQRVAMGRAIVRKPRVFLMDEPLSNLDAKLRVATRSQIAALQRRLGITTVYVTHDQVEAMTMGDRVAVMKDGLLQQVDVPRVLYDSPVNAFVAGFIGSPAMNFVTAQLVRDDGSAVTFAGHQLPLPAEMLDAKPGLSDYIGREVILGVRPSDFEDASLADSSWARLSVTVDVTEELGSEIHVIFSIDAAPVRHDSISGIVDESGDDASMVLASGKSLWTARVAARSRVRQGQPVELAVDTSNLQFFDPVTALSIGHPAARELADAAEVPATG
jgi:multiple sugar transport system ATP-binding protein